MPDRPSLLTPWLSSAEFDTVDHWAADAGLDDDVGEFVRVGEPALGVDGQLKRLALGHGRLADLSGGHLDVLLADGGDHVHGVQVESRQPIRVEPDPQAVVALTHVADAGNAGDAGQLILDEDGRVVAEINRIVFFALPDQVHDQQRVGGLLLDGDALVLDQGRDHRQGQRDAVLHQHLGHVRVHAQLEGHRQGIRAVVGTLRRHVEHALDAADLLLDR